MALQGIGSHRCPCLRVDLPNCGCLATTAAESLALINGFLPPLLTSFGDRDMMGRHRAMGMTALGSLGDRTSQSCRASEGAPLERTVTWKTGLIVNRFS